MGKKLVTAHHTIRLRHPWQSEAIEDRVLWSRKFNWPAELTGSEVVRLAIEPIADAASITLNDAPLRAEPAMPIEVTDLLRGHNRLEITCRDEQPTEQCPFEVRLEIVEG